MLLTSIPLGLYHIIRWIFPQRVADRFGYAFTRMWALGTVLLSFSTVQVIGREKLTASRDVCFMSNHQGLFDIPLLMGWIGRPVGFIGKMELRKFPFLSGWMLAIHSVFLDRSNARKAVDSINVAAETIKSGHAIAIFPEGTRSKTGEIGEFKSGSFKLAFNANAVIQPVTIYGTRNCYEAKHRIHKAHLTMIIHDPVYPFDELYKDKPALILHIQSVVTAAFEQLREQQS
jgi:1-acyl-sn-glycerol-3-phosphate acyltransferase